MLSPHRLDLPQDMQAPIWEASAIVAALRYYRNQRPKRVPLNLIGRLSGVSTDTLGRIVKHGFVRQDTARRLTPVLYDLASKRLIVRKAGFLVQRNEPQAEIATTPTRREPTAKEAAALQQKPPGAPQPSTT